MPYYLWKEVVAIHPKLLIERSEYDEIISAWRALTAIAEIEDEWDCLIQNYIELEMELLRVAMRTMVLDCESRDEAQDARLTFARRLSNLLQSCRAYLDHVPRLLKGTAEVGFANLFRKLTNEAYDSQFSYRFMEELRNHAQHRGLPLHGTVFDSSWTLELRDGMKEKGVQRHSVTAIVNLRRLRADKAFKPKILAELDPDLSQLDVATLAREYEEALGGVHRALQEKMADTLSVWKAAVLEAIGRYGNANDGNVLALCVGEWDDDGQCISKTYIFDEMITRFERMMRRNGNLVNLRKRYVSNELNPRKES